MGQPAHRSHTTIRPTHLRVADAEAEQWRAAAERKRFVMGVVFALLGVLAASTVALGFNWLFWGQLIALGVGVFGFVFLSVLILERVRS